MVLVDTTYLVYALCFVGIIYVIYSQIKESRELTKKINDRQKRLDDFLILLDNNPDLAFEEAINQKKKATDKFESALYNAMLASIANVEINKYKEKQQSVA